METIVLLSMRVPFLLWQKTEFRYSDMHLITSIYGGVLRMYGGFVNERMEVRIMLQCCYSKKKLYGIAEENYQNLVRFCRTLEEEGYWNQPEEILQKSIMDVLDMYVQALLMNLAIFSGKFQKREKQFIIDLPKTNAISCSLEENIAESIILTAKKMVSSPPILMQLCGIRDLDKDSFFSGNFFDSVLNIMLSMTYYTELNYGFATRFIQEYYEKNQVFLNAGQVQENRNNRYLFRKLSIGYFDEEKIQKVKLDEEEKENGKEEDNVLNAAQEKEKEKKEYTDEELAQMMRDGTLKISAPKLRELQQQKLEKMEREMEDAKVKKITQSIRENRLEKLLEELNNLIGLQDVKDEINSLINLIKVRKMREDFGMPMLDMTYHMVFTGNPGTGKTTVARLVAQIYKELGLLSKGTLIETDRSGLVAGYVGQTAIKVKQVVEKALGGVLFIDEAYSLTSNGIQNDFGGEVIDTLVKMMEDHRDNLVVIVAGYKKEMEEFLKSNTGLVSRFNKFIDFPDYTIEELMKILDSMAENSGVYFEEDAKQLLKRDIENMPDRQAKAFGNARGIRNTFETIMVNQANRIVTLKEATKEELSLISSAVVEQVI